MSAQQPSTPSSFHQIRINQGYPAAGCRVKAALSLSEVAIVALFMIGCIGASGAFPGSMSIGWAAVGGGAGLAVLSVCAGNLRGRKLKVLTSALMAATLITVGALGGAGILSATQVGWALIGTVLVSIPLRFGIYGYQTRAVTTSPSSLPALGETVPVEPEDDEESVLTSSEEAAVAGKERLPPSEPEDSPEEVASKGQGQDKSSSSPAERAEQGRQKRAWAQAVVRRFEEKSQQQDQQRLNEISEQQAQLQAITCHLEQANASLKASAGGFQSGSHAADS
ncbi:MAG: hypothetical protein S4CHLAM2_18550 [Chlamydiales bacterium]|nr:hypothetical protein [Chlamydiales bacterium]